MKTFITSDTHFGHKNIYGFLTESGARLRPWAENAEDGDKYIIERWNSIVSPEDRVYHLGDVAMKPNHIKTIAQCNGRKILIKGNHDKHSAQEYLKYFDDIRAIDRIDTFILSHVPVHPDSIPHWAKANIHGHTHSYMVKHTDYLECESPNDPRYFNACLEPNNCLPIDFEKIKKIYDL